jgi:hypothetical protein
MHDPGGGARTANTSAAAGMVRNYPRRAAVSQSAGMPARRPEYAIVPDFAQAPLPPPGPAGRFNRRKVIQ